MGATSRSSLTDKEILDEGRRVISAEANGLLTMAAHLDATFCEAARKIAECRGRVVTTVFAASTTQRRTAYGVPNAIVQDALRQAERGRTVSTGPCVAG